MVVIVTGGDGLLIARNGSGLTEVGYIGRPFLWDHPLFVRNTLGAAKDVMDALPSKGNIRKYMTAQKKWNAVAALYGLNADTGAPLEGHEPAVTPC